MAKGRSLGSAQRGIAFSTISAFVVSVLILIVGAGYHNSRGDNTYFTVTELGAFIQQFVGKAGVIVYSCGFISAALSSMLTVPLGAALTADSVFSDDANEANDVDADEASPGEKYTINSDKIPVPTSPSKVPMSPEKSEKISIPPSSPEKKLLPLSPQSLHASELSFQVTTQDQAADQTHSTTNTENTEKASIKLSNSQPAELGLTIEAPVEEPQKLPRLVYLGIMFGMVIISLIVISANGNYNIKIFFREFCSTYNLINFSRPYIRNSCGSSFQWMFASILLHLSSALPQ